ncbi:MAG TPA: Flp family type IVb pilin [Mesorhizobium sp.]
MKILIRRFCQARFFQDRRGATAIEYGLIAALLSLAIFAGFGNVADRLEWLWSDNSSRLVQGMN